MSGRSQVIFLCYHRVVFLERAILVYILAGILPACVHGSVHAHVSRIDTCLRALSSLSRYLHIPNTSMYKQQNNTQACSSLHRLLVA